MLSEKAQERKREVINWGRRTTSGRHWYEQTRDGFSGRLVSKRLYMIVGQVLVPDVAGVHLLDNDENWHIIEREMNIAPPLFEAHAPTFSQTYENRDGEQVPNWRQVLGTPGEYQFSIEQYFHRTWIKHNGDDFTLYPERVVDFPDYGFFGVSEVRTALGLRHGSLNLSTDNSIKSLQIVRDGYAINVPVSPGVTEWSVTESSGNTVMFSVLVEPADPRARVVLGEAVEFTGTSIDIEWKIIAEDDSEQNYVYSILPGQIN